MAVKRGMVDGEREAKAVLLQANKEPPRKAGLAPSKKNARGYPRTKKESNLSLFY